MCSTVSHQAWSIGTIGTRTRSGYFQLLFPCTVLSKFDVYAADPAEYFQLDLRSIFWNICVWRVRLSFGGSTVLFDSHAANGCWNSIVLGDSDCFQSLQQLSRWLFFCQTAVNKGHRKLAPPFTHYRARFWFCRCGCADPHIPKYSIQCLTSAFQLCSPVCVLAAIINGGKNSTFWEMCLFVFCRRAAQTDKNNYIKVVLNSRMNLRRGILHYSEYASIENLILDWKLPKLLQVSSAGQSFCVWGSSWCWQIFRCRNSVVDICIPVWVCFELKPEGYTVGPQHYS